ncbi:hypothetical protein KHQ81_15580 (plasmid) [Mycoplasmatota bacterium]|nr:hypothetical protein KHQ81_15580 [Mycoplasmatota bacterium]
MKGFKFSGCLFTPIGVFSKDEKENIIYLSSQFDNLQSNTFGSRPFKEECSSKEKMDTRWKEICNEFGCDLPSVYELEIQKQKETKKSSSKVKATKSIY